MKKIYLFLFVLAFAKSQSQCSGSQTASMVITTSYSVNSSSDPSVIKVCSTGIAYDTVSGLNRVWYLEPGATLYLKSNPTTIVYMKSGSTLINKGGASAIIAYTEPGVTITNQGTPPVNNNTCVAVSFPAAPSCTTTGIAKQAPGESLIFHPNPAKEKIYVSGTAPARLIEVYELTGKQVLCSANASEIDIRSLWNGLYLLRIHGADGSVRCARVIVQQ